MISSVVHISPSAFVASAEFAGKTVAQDDFAKKIDALLQKQNFDEAFDALAAVSDQIIEKASQKGAFNLQKNSNKADLITIYFTLLKFYFFPRHWNIFHYIDTIAWQAG